MFFVLCSYSDSAICELNTAIQSMYTMHTMLEIQALESRQTGAGKPSKYDADISLCLEAFLVYEAAANMRAGKADIDLLVGSRKRAHRASRMSLTALM